VGKYGETKAVMIKSLEKCEVQLKSDQIAQSNLGTGRVATLWWQSDPLITATRNRSTVFGIWRQCARPSNTRFFWPTPLITPNGSSINSVVFPQYALVTNGQTDRQNDNVTLDL